MVAKQRTWSRRLWNRSRLGGLTWDVILCLLLLGLVVVLTVFAPWVVSHDPLQQDLTSRLVRPTGLAPGEGVHPLGTDHLGRDLLARIVYGARVSLIVGTLAVVVGGAIGTALGLIAGYRGGKVDEFIMTLADIQLAFPFILLAIAVIAVLGVGIVNLVLVVGLSGWVTYARLVRAEVLALREREFIEAVRALGGSEVRILRSHILPNLTSSLIVVTTLELARAILLESTLSFLGLGVQPPIPSWGGILNDGRPYVVVAWWIPLFPGLALLLLCLSINHLGDWLRDRLDASLSVKSK